MSSSQAGLGGAKTFRTLRRAAAAMFAGLVEQGSIDPAGKTADELRDEILRLLLSLKAKPRPFRIITDYRSNLLRLARSFAREKGYPDEIALMFYATWFEHWINGLFASRAQTCGFTGKAMLARMRWEKLKDKYQKFPTLVKLPSIASSHLKTVLECSEIRNDFVHYKFAGDSDSLRSIDRNDRKIRKVIAQSEKAVRYLSRYERIHLFKGAKSRMKRLAFDPRRGAEPSGNGLPA
jgi:hypothetical protein